MTTRADPNIEHAGGFVAPRTRANSWAPHQGPAMGRSMMVAADHPIAAELGLSVLRAGGNAIDAAAATSFLLTVLKPTRSALGGDLFYLVYSAATGKVTAINGSGAAPAGATLEAYAGGIPERGMRSVAVPGFVDGVLAALDRFGSRPLASLIAPAIEHARDGFPISLRQAQQVEQFATMLQATPATATAFMPGGRLPRPGQLFRQPDLARTLEEIAAQGRDGFYGGRFAEALIRTSREQGGHFEAADLAAHQTEICEPIRVSYRGLTVYGQPPVTQGHILLEELRLIDGFDLAGRAPDDPELIHLMIEAKKLAFADRLKFAGDPRRSDFAVERLFDDRFIVARRAQINTARATALPAAATALPRLHDTTSFAVVDAAGNAVAAIQSVFFPWGSGVVVDGTGVLLNNRLTGFVVEPGHPNAIEPGKRPVHTLNNYLITSGDRPVLVGGTPGGQQQVQTNMQIISGVVDSGLDVQTANDFPRWGHESGLDVVVESRYDPAVLRELERLGHRLRTTSAWDVAMGRAMVIGIDKQSGVRTGGADLRGEGRALGW